MELEVRVRAQSTVTSARMMRSSSTSPSVSIV